MHAIYPYYHKSESYNAYLTTEQYQQTVSFTVQNKHRSSLITTAVTLTRTRRQFRDIATKRLAASPSTRALLQLHTVQQCGGKIQRRSTCDVMNLSDCTGCSSRQSFPFYLSSPFEDCYTARFSSRLPFHLVCLNSQPDSSKVTPVPSF